MKTKLLLFIATCLSIAVYAQTIVPAGPVSGTWTLAGSPYLIEGETDILDNTTLTIEAGVRVEWQGSYPMWVYGQLLAQGTEADSIIFIAANPVQGFQGIRFFETPEENDTSRFAYCLFKYGRVYKPVPNNSGGALLAFDFSKIIIDHCLFTKNTAIVVNEANPAGGAIALANSSPVIMNCSFVDNLSMSAGAILCYENSHPLIENNFFTENTADGEGLFEQGYGGAISCYKDCNPIIQNNIFSNNYAESGGGAIACVSRCEPLIIQNLFTDNTCDWIGGAIELQDTCDAQIINNTIVNNFGDFGGGIHLWDDDIANITNTIIWGNHANDGSAGQIYAETGSSCIVNLYYSGLMGGWDGIGGDVTGEYEYCLEDIPWFVGCGDHPFQVNDNSPYIDAGDPDYEELNLPELDLAGEIRIFNNEVDIGAYEWNPLVGMDESDVQASKSEVLLYPNPFSTSTTFEFELFASGNIEYLIYNQLGELIELKQMNVQSGKQIITWDADGFPSGIYFLKIQVGTELMVRKMIKL